MKRLILLAAWLCVICLPAMAWAQAPARDAKLILTVSDPLGGVVPSASVTVSGVDAATKAAQLAPVKTTDKGVATVENLVPGKYTVQVEFGGFEVGVLKDITLKAGENKQAITLALKKVEDSVTISRDKQAAAADRSVGFGSALTREQIDALSDDPDEMARQLKQIAGPDAVIRVDSFEGAQLPPKSQIKSIHITRDTFAAEAHAAGFGFIDIITQPGIGPIRANTRLGYYNSAFDGQNPLVAKRGPAANQSYGGGLGGTLVKNRSNFSISLNGGTSYSTPSVFVATPTGVRSEYLDLRAPTSNVSVSGLLDYAVTKDQTLRFGISGNQRNSSNLGAGGYNQIERTYSNLAHGASFRVQEAGPIGRRFFTNTRFAMNWTDQESHSVIEAPTYIVSDAFTSGGAQQRGGSHPRNFQFASDLDYVRGIHSWRTGVQLDGGHYRTDQSSNYLGTYTFESLDAFNAGTPRSYTRRIGDPNINYWNLQFGYYVQDDIRVRKNLTVSAGIRLEAQTHLSDYNNLAPRVGFTWAPFKNGKTSIRASAGIFYDWLATGTYEQTLRIDGFRQQEINILNPTFPDPGNVGAASPINKYLLDQDMAMMRSSRLSASVSQNVNQHLSLGASYSYNRTRGVLVGQNLNTPVNGFRPDPVFANVIETVDDGQSRTHSLSANASLYFFPPTGPAANQKRLDWKRGLSIFSYYTLGRQQNNSDGAFSVPSTGDLAAEWGPASFDTRHRISMSLGTGALKNFNANVEISAYSGSPLTIRTGLDDNHDGIFNDRPVGVGRNSERVPGNWSSSAYFSYSLGLGKKTIAMPPGIMITSMGPAGVTMGNMSIPPQPRYRLNFNVSVNNLTNHATYTGYSGVMTSPFFLKATNASGVRSLNFSMALSF